MSAFLTAVVAVWPYVALLVGGCLLLLVAESDRPRGPGMAVGCAAVLAGFLGFLGLVL